MCALSSRGIQCALCNAFKLKTAFAATHIALGSNRRHIHCSQKQKELTNRSLQDAPRSCVQTLQRANGNLVPESVVLPVSLQKVSINLTNMRKARVCIPCGSPERKVSTKSKQPTFRHIPSLVMMKNMHYPREKGHMLFPKMNQLVINPNFSPLTMKSMYYIQSELRRTIPKNGLLNHLHPTSPQKRILEKYQDTASSSNMTKAQCLLDLPIASCRAMYEYLDKNNFEVGMHLPRLRKQS